MTVYVDVLVILNLYINYFLIRATAVITRRECSKKRSIAAALIGAFGALAILMPELPILVVALEKTLLGAVMVFVAFGRQKAADYAVSALFFLLVSFSFAGLMMATWTFLAPSGMVFSNGIAYLNIPLTAVIAFTAAAYFVMKLARFFSDKRIKCNKICSVIITVNGSQIHLRGLCDTGNDLCDIITGKPVIICSLAKIGVIVPHNVLDYFDGKISDEIRLIPMKTISSETLLPIFKADKISIDGKSASAIIGVTKNSMQSEIDCIFNPKIISI